MKKKITQAEIIMEFFRNNPKRDIEHPEIVDWVTKEYQMRTGEVFRDPDRQIRKFHQGGTLIKVKKGVYKYDLDFVIHKQLEDFTEQQKEIILKRDGYQCVICAKGLRDGVELHVDHIKPKDKGGKAEIENGQTLCSTHNFRKKNYKQTESGKKMFIRLYELSKAIGDKETMDFCVQILETYKSHDVNGHIEWKK